METSAGVYSFDVSFNSREITSVAMIFVRIVLQSYIVFIPISQMSIVHIGYGSLHCRLLMKKAEYFVQFILGFHVGLKNKPGSEGTSAGGESGESERHSHWLHEDQ